MDYDFTLLSAESLAGDSAGKRIVILFYLYSNIMGIYKSTYYVGFIENFNTEPEQLCLQFANLFDCNVQYHLDTDDKNSNLPKNKFYNFGKSKTIKINHYVFLEIESYEGGEYYLNVIPDISFDIDLGEIYNHKADLWIFASGYFEHYVDYIYWKSISLSYHDTFNDDMKIEIIKHRPIPLSIFKKLGCHQALILPDILCEVLMNFMDVAMRDGKPVKCFDDMIHILEIQENVHYYNIQNLLNDTESINDITTQKATAFIDDLNA